MTENPAFFPCEPHDIWWEAGCDSPNVVFSENGFLFNTRGTNLPADSKLHSGFTKS